MSYINVRAVLVDMDGTAVDSNAVVEMSWAKVAEEFGLNLEEVLAFSHGRPGTETYARFVPHLPADEVEQRITDMLAHEETLAHLAQPILGADRFLHRLVELGVPWALVTSATRSLASARFKHAELPWPEVAVPFEDITVGKPDPEGYLTAAAALGIPIEDCVVFEDAPAGIRAGLRSGAPVIVVDPTGPLDHSRLESDRALAPFIAAQVPHLESVEMEATPEPGLFRLSW